MLEEVRDATGAFAHFRKLLQDHGRESAPRGIRCVEINGAGVRIENAGDNVINHPARRISEAYLVFELLWYAGADNSKAGVEMISTYGKMWKNLTNPDGSVNSNYGHYFFADLLGPGKSQFGYVLEKLRQDPNSRQAVVNINSMAHKTIEGCKDFPCTFSVQFLIRGKKLHSIVCMRSTDLVLGFCNDIYQFSQLQRLLLAELNSDREEKLGLGSISLFTNSLHLYESNYKILDSWYDSSNERYSYTLRDYSKDAVQVNRKTLEILTHLERNLRTKTNWKKSLVITEILKRHKCPEVLDMLGIMLESDQLRETAAEFGLVEGNAMARGEW
jgi:thymidylate synthase